MLTQLSLKAQDDILHDCHLSVPLLPDLCQAPGQVFNGRRSLSSKGHVPVRNAPPQTLDLSVQPALLLAQEAVLRNEVIHHASLAGVPQMPPQASRARPEFLHFLGL